MLGEGGSYVLPALASCTWAPAVEVLPRADEPYAVDWDEVHKVFAPTAARRARLLAAQSRLELLSAAGLPIVAVWLNGSFVTSKSEPKDLDVVVIIDGQRATRELGPTEANDLVEAHGRYEPGATDDQHLTDFHYVWWYPDDHPFGQAARGELDFWFTLWSRVEVDPEAHTGERRFVSDAKGFLEVRW